MTFSGHRRDLDRLAEGVSFGVTVPTVQRPLATRLVADLGGSVEWVEEHNRPLYHAALAHGANHLVTLTNEALDRLRDAGVRTRSGYSARCCWQPWRTRSTRATRR